MESAWYRFFHKQPPAQMCLKLGTVAFTTKEPPAGVAKRDLSKRLALKRFFFFFPFSATGSTDDFRVIPRCIDFQNLAQASSWSIAKPQAFWYYIITFLPLFLRNVTSKLGLAMLCDLKTELQYRTNILKDFCSVHQEEKPMYKQTGRISVHAYTKLQLTLYSLWKNVNVRTPTRTIFTLAGSPGRIYKD